MRHAAIIAMGALIGASTLSGCASHMMPHAGVELDQIPFYPDTLSLCGPSALATVLDASGAEVSLPGLIDQVHIPRRSGTLQAELVAAARRYDRLAIRLEPADDAIHVALDAGYPVLILQNLGVGWMPAFHYAVVVGRLPEHGPYVLRSGDERRRMTRPSTLRRTWRRAGAWAVVVVRPGVLPHFVSRASYLAAAVGLESSGRHAAALQAYRSGADRWPDEPLFLLGAGNSQAALNRLDSAASTYATLLRRFPGYPIAVNNLASVRGLLGCPSMGIALVDDALQRRDLAEDLTRLLQATRAELIAQSERAGGAACVPQAGTQSVAQTSGQADPVDDNAIAKIRD